MSERKDHPASGQPDSARLAVKTTIVGGQPAGNARPLPPVPVGIEHLLALAAVNDAFAGALFAERPRTIEASGVTLSTTERHILESIEDAALQQMVTSVDQSIDERDRRSFLGQSAAAVVALVGGGAALAACNETRATKGVRPDRPPHQLGGETGARPDRPDEKDKPEPKAAPDAGCTKPRPPAPPPESDLAGVRPGRPDRLPRETGARPDRPGRKFNDTGARPDTPQGAGTGARPDRPIKK